MPWSCADTRQLLPSRPEISSSPIYIPYFLCRSKVNTGERSWLQGELGVWPVSSLCHLVKCWNNGERQIPSLVCITDPWHQRKVHRRRGPHWTERNLLKLAKWEGHLLASYILPHRQVSKDWALTRWALKFLVCSILGFLLANKWFGSSKQKQANKTTKLYPITTKIFTLQIALG